MNKDQFVARVDGLYAVDIDGEIGLLSPINGNYYMLDDIGSDIWGMMEHPISIDALINNLMVLYDVDALQCSDDILVLLNSLLAESLITITDN